MKTNQCPPFPAIAYFKRCWLTYDPDFCRQYGLEDGYSVLAGSNGQLGESGEYVLSNSWWPGGGSATGSGLFGTTSTTTTTTTTTTPVRHGL